MTDYSMSRRIRLTNELRSWVLVMFLPMFLGVLWPFLILPWIGVICWWIYRQFIGVKFVTTTDKAIYITGCDSGFGQAAALELDLRGCRVFAGCLNPEAEGALFLRAQASDRLTVLDLDVTDESKVQKCAQKIERICAEEGLNAEGALFLRAQASDRLTVLDLDVTDESKVKKCAQKIERICEEEGLNGLWALCNNAGIARAGEIDWVELDELKQSMEVNYWGPVRVTKSVLHLIRRSKGRVVTITSGLARSVMPGRGAYAVSKVALDAFMDCLRYEMSKFGVKCCTIQPGNLTSQTQIFEAMAASIDRVYERMSETKRQLYGRRYLDAFKDRICGSYRSGGGDLDLDVVTDAMSDAVLAQHPRTHYKPAQLSWLLWWGVYDLFPSDLTDWAMAYWHRTMPTPAAIGR